MPLDAWLPVGYKLPDGVKVRVAVSEGVNWQIYENQGGGRALVRGGDVGLKGLAQTLLGKLFENAAAIVVGDDDAQVDVAGQRGSQGSRIVE